MTEDRDRESEMLDKVGKLVAAPGDREEWWYQ